MAAAFLRDTRRIQLIEDDEIVAVTLDGATFWTVTAASLSREARSTCTGTGGREGRLRDVHAQGDLRAAGRDRGDDRRPDPSWAARARRAWPRGRGDAKPQAHRHRRVRHRVPLGSRRALRDRGMRIPVEHDIASEWRYRNPVLSRDTLVIGITQSGRPPTRWRRCGWLANRARTLAITNMMGTQITREVDSVIYTRLRDERRGHEDVHVAGLLLSHRAAARPGAQVHAGRGDCGATRGGARAPGEDDRSWPATTPSTRSRSATSTSRSSSSWGAT